MPSEARAIKFTNDELMTALFRYSQHVGESELIGLPTKVELSQEGTVSATLHSSHHHPITCSAAQIAAALILICVRQKIPVPKTAEKSVQIQGDNVVLFFKSGDAPPLLAVAS